MRTIISSPWKAECERLLSFQIGPRFPMVTLWQFAPSALAILRLAGRSSEAATVDHTDGDAAAVAVRDAQMVYDRINTEHDRLETIREAKYGPQPRPDNLVTQEERIWGEASGHKAICRQSDAAGGLLCEKERDLLFTPAPHFPALVYKLEWSLDEYTDAMPEARAMILADVHRLLGKSTLATTANEDGAIVDAWERRREAFLARALLPDVNPPQGELYTAEEQALWDVIDGAEDVIQNEVALTPRGVAFQLWFALTRIADEHDRTAKL